MQRGCGRTVLAGAAALAMSMVAFGRQQSADPAVQLARVESAVAEPVPDFGDVAVAGVDRTRPPRPCTQFDASIADRTTWVASLWPGGVVPYTFDSNVSVFNQTAIREAMDELQTVANVRFKPRAGEGDFVVIAGSTGNNATVGRIGGQQSVNIFNWNFLYIMEHELMHTLGCRHEQARPDRDGYVTINLGNVCQNCCSGASCNHNFNIATNTTPFGSYDFESIMHYGAYDFSTNGQPTIVAQPAYAAFQPLMGNRDYLSIGDKAGLESRYGVVPDDTHEPNDSFATAAELGSGGAFDLKLSRGLNDYFTVQLGGGTKTITVRAWRSASTEQARLWLYSAAGAQLAVVSLTPSQDIRYSQASFNTNAPAGTYVLRFGRSLSGAADSAATHPQDRNYRLTIPTTCQTWTTVGAFDGPMPRKRPRLAFDSVRNRTVLVGGAIPPGGSINDTWEWDGNTWVMRASDVGPTERLGASIAFDSFRGETLVFGGARPYGGPAVNELWSWNGTTWTLRTPGGNGAAPSARLNAVMAYDSLRGVTMMYGGYDGSYRNDLWEWNGTQWIIRDGGGPTNRDDAAMGFDPERGVLVIFGGYDFNGQIRNDTWEWTFNPATGSGTFVQPVLDSSPPGLIEATMVWDENIGKMVLFGGGSGGTNFSGDCWVYEMANPAAGDLAYWRRELGVTPSARQTMMAFDTTRNRRIIFGGNDGSNAGTSDTWEHDGVKWTPRAGPAPEGREQAITGYDAARGRVYMFGGDANGAQNDIWMWGGQAWGRIHRINHPGARWGAASAYFTGLDRLVLFGGYNSGNFDSQDTWRFNPAIAQWEQMSIAAPLPAARSLSAAAYDSQRGRMVLFGGLRQSGFLAYGDTWEYDGSTWTQVTGGFSPQPRFGHAMAYDPVRGRVVMFGGADQNNQIHADGTWEYDGTSWQPLFTFGDQPHPRMYHRMSWNPIRQRIVMMGGRTTRDNIDAADTWEFDGQNWVQTAAGVPTREAPLLEFDGAGTLVFGGYIGGGTFRADSQRYNGPAAPGLSVVRLWTNTCGRSTVDLEVAAASTTPVTFEWRRNGLPVVNDPGHIAGAATSRLTITRPRPSDAGTYSCLVTNACGSVALAPVQVTYCPYEFDCNGQFSVNDLFAFLAAFFGGDLRADIDGNGTIGAQDLFDFLAGWFATCA